MRPRRYRLRATVWIIRRLIAALDAMDRGYHAWYLAKLDEYDCRYDVVSPEQSENQ